LGVPQKEINSVYAQLYASKFFMDIKQKVKVPLALYYLSMLSPLRAPLLYLICRITKPEIVVETGVKDGFSSSFILFALEMNKKGRLYSIDLPNSQGQELGPDKDTGWLVPEELKPRWSLILGSSDSKLPALLQDIGKIDIFIHDSDHSYQNMIFEFKQSWGYLKAGGYLLSDDITDNQAFADFVRLNGCINSLRLFKSGIAIR